MTDGGDGNAEASSANAASTAGAAATSGADDIVEAVTQRHAAIAEAFATLASATDDEREARFAELIDKVTRHEIAEQNVVHPVVAQEGDPGSRIAADRRTEEQEVNRAMAELEDLGFHHPDFAKTLQTFHETVLSHIAQEEQEEFPLLRGLPAGQRSKMAEEFARMSDAID